MKKKPNFCLLYLKCETRKKKKPNPNPKYHNPMIPIFFSLPLHHSSFFFTLLSTPHSRELPHQLHSSIAIFAHISSLSVHRHYTSIATTLPICRHFFLPLVLLSPLQQGNPSPAR